MLGDVILAFETARGEASDLGISLSHHAGHLIVHGVLHLRSYDHHTDAAARSMEGEERRILARFGIRDPYARLDAKAAVDG
jgi:probable rRNA maturation factor